VAPSAGAASPLADCAQRVIRDWAADGSVDDVVPLACYRAALQVLPEDVLQYSDAGQSIEDAMAFARERRSEALDADARGVTPEVEPSATSEHRERADRRASRARPRRRPASSRRAPRRSGLRWS
jgi:hypothetical protein